MSQLQQLVYLDQEPQLRFGRKKMEIIPQLDMSIGQILEAIMQEQGVEPELFDEASKNILFNVGGVHQRAMDFIVKAGIKVGLIPAIKGG